MVVTSDGRTIRSTAAASDTATTLASKMQLRDTETIVSVAVPVMPRDDDHDDVYDDAAAGRLFPVPELMEQIGKAMDEEETGEQQRVQT